jgi:hypothetical protein
MIWLVVAEALAIVVLSWKMYGALCRLESLDADVALMQRERGTVGDHVSRGG